MGPPLEPLEGPNTLVCGNVLQQPQETNTEAFTIPSQDDWINIYSQMQVEPRQVFFKSSQNGARDRAGVRSTGLGAGGARRHSHFYTASQHSSPEPQPPVTCLPLPQASERPT